MGCTLAVVAVAWLLRPVLRASPTARFFGLGLLLSVLPGAAIFPSARMLLFASFGGGGQVA